ncbi:glycosyltransferase family 2 protein [Stygiobacter electus]|uniref:Glycosyltransferase family 2 protein n=1 Tax=Stygiobacter electus TaxID=3032292 RepID=A0AAE3TF82_9BACT|nr:glycosyltransferase family 2 protein [Stygiobacter electus]MDF1613098.1 glycosyltransferase family 2 protein [Stygiobacter electus]
MKFSIVTISFNQAAYVEKAILSVLRQKDVELEYIVVDPGSTDGSRDIIMKYKDQINKIIFENDSGPANGLNKGFSYATGEIFGYLNSDDILEFGALKKVEHYFSTLSNIDILAGHCYIINQEDKIIHKSFSHKMTPLKYLRKHAILIQQSTFFKRKIFEKVGGFNDQNKIAWDGEIFFEMLKMRARLKIVNDYFSSFRIYSDSISGNEDYLEKLNKYYEKLRQINSYEDQNILINYFNYILHWLSQPTVLFLRLIDQLQHPKRII